MEIWLDTSDSEKIRNAARLGILTGVTTNPSILSKDPRELNDILQQLLAIQKGPVAVQVLADNASEMIEQGKKLNSFSERFIVKIPVTQEGLSAIHALSEHNIMTMGTVVYYPKQALLAAEAGAHYIAPYISHIEKSGEDPWKVLQLMQKFNQNYAYPTRILGASLTTVEQILKCAEIGLDAVTIKPELFQTFTADNPLTLSKIEQFESDWKNQKTAKNMSLRH